MTLQADPRRQLAGLVLRIRRLGGTDLRFGQDPRGTVLATCKWQGGRAAVQVTAEGYRHPVDAARALGDKLAEVSKAKRGRRK